VDDASPRPPRAVAAERIVQPAQPLSDAPQAYFASLESEVGLPLSYWEDWATSEEKVVFVAEEDGSWLGMAGAFVHPDKRGHGESVVAVGCTERARRPEPEDRERERRPGPASSIQRPAGIASATAGRK
jgi:hypothetical protein